ncbi:hypothetical protein [Methanotorris igneus]|nr:hypothetical protein [Methanotorris igneus]
METDDMFPMNPEGTEADDIQVQRGHLSMIVHVGQTPVKCHSKHQFTTTNLILSSIKIT